MRRHHNENERRTLAECGPDKPIGSDDPAAEAVRRNEDGSVEW